MSGTEHFAEASALLASVQDIISERVRGSAPPSWCSRRGWVDFLESLKDDVVLSIERDGLLAHIVSIAGAPADLIALTRDVARMTTLARGDEHSLERVDARRTSPRKRIQVASFASLVNRLNHQPSRIVDIGSGHGHLTRHLARALGVPAEGWERDPERVAVARSLSGEDGPRFVATDVRANSLGLSRSDLVVGLHACGDLGDHAVRAASEVGASVAIVGCCLQKRADDRTALVVPDRIAASSLVLTRPTLGLGNACTGEQGVESDLATRTRSRINRAAFRTLLSAAGDHADAGAEMHGINRRRSTGTLEHLVEHGFAARGLAAPSTDAIRAANEIAHRDYARACRWTLPRTMLGRLMEVWVALDRSAWLSTRGYQTEVVLAFSAEASPRNVCVLASQR